MNGAELGTAAPAAAPVARDGGGTTPDPAGSVRVLLRDLRTSLEGQS